MKSLHSVLFLKRILTATFIIALSTSCGTRVGEIMKATRSGKETTALDSGNAVYYWKTVFRLGGEERRFIKEHYVDRMYLRMFYVDIPSTSENGSETVIPVATTIFKDSIPKGVEIVPTVFITVNAIREMSSQTQSTSDLSSKILKRILNMVDFNDLGMVQEIQLDCDWTPSTQEDFFNLCEKIKSEAIKEGISISSTIRHHQLQFAPPPVDRGVLMLYNTGNFKAPGKRNSILDYGEVKQYLKERIIDYPLPLDFAYPAYSWGVWFRGETFMSLLHHEDFSDKTFFRDAEGNGIYSVLKDCVIEGHDIKKGDIIRLEKPSFETIRKVSQLVRKAFPDIVHRNIIYHLDSAQTAIFTNDEIKEIYSF